MRTVTQIGFEAEVIVAEGSQILIASKKHLPHDDFGLLAEIRAEPAENCLTAAANLLVEFHKFNRDIAKRGFRLHPATFRKGYTTIDGALYTEVLRDMGTKNVSEARNVYGTDILSESDLKVEDGRVVGTNVSCGLHIHISCENVETDAKTKDEEIICKKCGKSNKTGHYITTVAEAKVSRLNQLTISHIIQQLDEQILPLYLTEDMAQLKHRNPGYWEPKYHGGFEYRSMPFTKKVLDNIFQIAMTVNDIVDSAVQ